MRKYGHLYFNQHCFSLLNFTIGTTVRLRTHGNVFLRFCIVFCSQGNREQPAHYLKQYKNAGKRFHVYGALTCLQRA